MDGLRVAVLRGGPSSEYDVSLKSGANILKSLPEHIERHDIFIDRQGNWHFKGMATDPVKALRNVDVVFNAMHGQYGEDGKVQKLLENINMPFTGADSLGAFFAMNKVLAKKKLGLLGLQTPGFSYIKKHDYTRDTVANIMDEVGYNAIVKPANTGSSLGIKRVSSLEDMIFAIEEAFNHSDLVLIEEFVDGIELTCGVLDHSNGEEVFALYPIEIEHNSESGFWDYNNKYNGESHKYHIPARVPKSVREEVQRASVFAHNNLGLRHYSRSDFIYVPGRGLFFLETNALPGLTETSLYPHSLEQINVPFEDFLEHVLNLAVGR